MMYKRDRAERKHMVKVRKDLLASDIVDDKPKISKFRKRNYRRAQIRTNYQVKMKLYPIKYPFMFLLPPNRSNIARSVDIIDSIRHIPERYKNAASNILPVDNLDWLDKPDDVPEYHICLDWPYPKNMYKKD